MKYYGNVTTQLQFILVKGWVEEHRIKRIIGKLIGESFIPKVIVHLLDRAMIK